MYGANVLQGTLLRSELRNVAGRVHQVDGFVIEVTHDMIGWIETYVDYVRELQAKVGGPVAVEKRVFMTHLHENCWGTLDAGLQNKDEIHVIDAKFGFVYVAATGWQGKLYISGWNQDYRPKRIYNHIVQPQTEGEPTRMVEYTRADLLEWEAEAQRIIAEIYSPDPSYNPSQDACRFCPAKGTCPALAAYVQAPMMAEFYGGHAGTLMDPKAMTTDQLALARTRTDMMEDWAEAVRSLTYKAALEGVSLPGFKLVRGKKGNKHWHIEEDTIEQGLKDLGIETPRLPGKLITPAIAAKKVELDPKWFDQAEGKLTLVPESDKREAVNVNSAIKHKLAAIGM
jgi:hypothetical protein